MCGRNLGTSEGWYCHDCQEQEAAKTAYKDAFEAALKLVPAEKHQNAMSNTP